MREKNQDTKRASVSVWIFAGVVFSFMLSFFLGQGGMLRLRELNAESDRMVMENYNIALKNRDLMQEIKKLRKDPATIEKIAREDLHYVSPHDLVLLVPDGR
jgi:cell division protein FtsB